MADNAYFNKSVIGMPYSQNAKKVPTKAAPLLSAKNWTTKLR